MKIIELLSKVRISITNEEADVLGKFHGDNIVVSRKDLNERELVVANALVVKDILYRKNDNGNITYQKKTN
jgi:hypothetical protein